MRLPRHSLAKCGARGQWRRTWTARSFMNFAQDLPGVGPKGDQVVGFRDYMYGRAHKFNGAEPVHSTLWRG